MLRLMMGAGAVCAVVMIVIVAFLSFTFWYGQGTSFEEKLAYGTGAAICEIGKALAPFFIYALWRTHRYIAVGAGVVAWLLFVGVSFTSAVGLGAESRHGSQARHERAQKRLGEAEETLYALQERRRQLGATRPSREIEAEREAALRLPVQYGRRMRTMAEASKDCTRPDAITAETCKRVGALGQELARANIGEQLETEIARQRQIRNDLLSRAEHDGKPDRQSAFFSRRIGAVTGLTLPENDVIDVLIILIATGFEAASGWLLYISLGGHELVVPVRKLPPGDVEEFCVTHLVPAEGAALEIDAAFGSYLAWCDRHRLSSVERPIFSAELGRITALNGLKPEGETYAGIAINAALARNAYEAAKGQRET